MEALSEDHFAAGWADDFGPSLWASLNGEVFVSRIGLMPDEIVDLRVLSEWAGGWWDWDDRLGDIRFFSSDEWNARYRAIREEDR